MPRPTNTDERRAQIARGLVRVMARRGYDGASVTEVAAAARLSPGLLHYHFENKQEILLEALRDLVARHDARIAQRLATAGGDPAAEVDAFIDLHLGLGAEADPEALACWILISGEALRQPRVRLAHEKALASWVNLLAGAIQRGVTAGVFQCADIEAAAAALLATIQGYFVLAGTSRRLIPRGSAATAAKRMAGGLLGTERSLQAPRRRRS